MSIADWLTNWSSWIWPMLIHHLWQATLFSGLAFALAFLLRRGPARARYTVWLIASAKFAFPSAFLAFLADRAGLAFRSAPTASQSLRQSFPVIAQIAEPLGNSVIAPVKHSWIFLILTGIWFLGCAVLLTLWIKRRIRFRIAMKRGRVLDRGREAEALARVRSWMSIRSDVRLAVCSAAAEPGVWRAWKPIIVLPENLADRLTEFELEAIMMHELAHVARRDNLLSNLHMVLSCLLWFNPIIWLIDRSLLREREKACDEEVIELSGAPSTYLAGIVKVSRFSLGQEMAGVSCAAGSDLKRRLSAIMANENNRRLTARHHILVGAVAIGVLAASLAAGLLGRDGALAQARAKQAVTRSSDAPVDGVLEGVPGGVPGGIPGGIPDGVPGGVPGGGLEGMSGAVFVQFQGTWRSAISHAQESPARYENSQNAPVTITDAKVRTLTRDEIQQALGAAPEEDARQFAVGLTASVSNNSDERVTALFFAISSTESTREGYALKRGVAIDPHSSQTVSLDIRRDLIAPGSPGTFNVRIEGLRFESGKVWGELPPPPPPPARKSSAPGFVGPTIIKQAAPVYPPLAKLANLSGAVVVEVTIGEDGSAAMTRALSGHPLLMNAAIEAAKQWKWKPATEDGQPVSVTTQLTFNFEPPNK